MLEESLYNVIEEHAEKKGLTVSRLISLTLKAAFTQRPKQQAEEKKIVPKGSLSDVTVDGEKL